MLLTKKVESNISGKRKAKILKPVWISAYIPIFFFSDKLGDKFTHLIQ